MSASTAQPAAKKWWFQEISPQQWHGFVASWLGYLLDGFDFVLMGLVLTEVAKEFHLSTPVAATLISAAFISRWFGGIVIGAVSDKYGRRAGMVLSILLFSVGSVVCAIAPAYWVLFAARLLVGLGMAGEYSASSTYVIESWPERIRNKASGFLISGYSVGTIIAGQMYALIVPNFGWRWLFAAGLVPIAIALWLRRHIPEAGDWEKMQQQTDRSQRLPDIVTALFRGRMRVLNIVLAAIAIVALVLIFGSIAKGPIIWVLAVVIAAIFISFQVQFTKGRWPTAIVLMLTVFCAFLYSWPIQALLPTYAKETLGYSAGEVAGVLAFSGAGAAAGCIVAGFTGDWLGTRRAYWISLVISQLIIFPVFFVGGSSLLLFGVLIFLQQVFGQGISGLLPKWIGGYFRPEQRSAGLGFTYNVGALGGAVAPVLGTGLAAGMSLGTSLAVISFSLTLVVIVLIGFNVPRLAQHVIRPQDEWKSDALDRVPRPVPTDVIPTQSAKR